MTRRAAPVVLVLSQLPPPVHGSTVMTQRLVATVRDLGLRPAVVQRRFSRTADDVGRVGARKVLAAPGLLLRLLTAAVRTRPAVCVFFLTNRPGSFLVDLALLAGLRALRVPVLLHLHTVGYRALADRSPLWRALVRRALGAGDVVTLGESLVDDVASLTARPVHVVPNTTAPPAGDGGPPRRAEAEGLHVVFLSNLDPEKGAEAFARTGARLAADRPGWRFTVAGSGGEARRAAVRAAAAGAPLEVVGAVDEAGKWALLDAADLLVFPSVYRYEAQPLTVVEAMSTGLPVVAYDTGGVRDLVVDGGTGRLVPAGDEAGLAAAIAALGDDAGERVRLGDGARRRFQERHSTAAYAAAWARLLPVPADDRPPAGFAGTVAAFRALAAADWRANPRDAKSRAVLLGFRLAQLAMGDRDRPRRAGMVVVAAYRFWTEFGIGLELRPKTRVGGGLTIYHGYGLVVNDHAVLGERVVLRNAVTIGQRIPGGPSPVLGDRVEVGAGALILGDIEVGAGGRVGAGSVVLQDVPAGAAVVGNPARVLPGTR